MSMALDALTAALLVLVCWQLARATWRGRRRAR